MSDIYNQISRTIFTINKLSIKFIIGIHNEKDPLFSDYGIDQNNGDTMHYLHLNYFPMISLELMDRGISRDRSNKIIITAKNHHVICKAFKNMIKILYSDDLFYYLDGRLNLYAPDEKQIIRVYNAGKSNNMILIPSIILDNEEKEYEGVRIFINKSDVFLDLSIDEFESLYENIRKIDIFLYSQSLLNYYIMYVEKIEPVVRKPEKKRSNLFNKPVEAVNSTVTSSGLINKKDNTFEGLGGL